MNGDGRDLRDEATYDGVRLGQWLEGKARSLVADRRHQKRLATSAAGTTAQAPWPANGGRKRAVTVAGSGPHAKPLPPDRFYVHGTNAEMRWEVMRGQGYLVPTDSFFIRNHTRTPLVDATTWALSVFGTGLAGSPAATNPVSFSYEDLLGMPARSVVSSIECAGNGRIFFARQQDNAVPGTQWRLGAIGVARWRGVPLATVLDRAGVTPTAVDVMPYGLDPSFVSGGIDYGPVRRPIPIAKALDDVILAYEMNGRPLPPDHGYPVRLIVPSWAGIANIKWVGQLEVSASPLFSYWNTRAYRLFGPDHPAGGALITRSLTNSAFELGWNARLTAGQPNLLTGRSWSGSGAIARTDVSTDGGRTWQRARVRAPGRPEAWQLWELTWTPPRPGSYALRARSTNIAGMTQPAVVPVNSLGYLFDGIVLHPVTAI